MSGLSRITHPATPTLFSICNLLPIMAWRIGPQRHTNALAVARGLRSAPVANHVAATTCYQLWFVPNSHRCGREGPRRHHRQVNNILCASLRLGAQMTLSLLHGRLTWVLYPTAAVEEGSKIQRERHDFELGRPQGEIIRLVSPALRQYRGRRHRSPGFQPGSRSPPSSALQSKNLDKYSDG